MNFELRQNQLFLKQSYKLVPMINLKNWITWLISGGSVINERHTSSSFLVKRNFTYAINQGSICKS